MIPEEQLGAIELVIFDLDGTLVDSEEDLAMSVNAVRGALDLEALPIAQVASYVGQGVHVLIRRALGKAASDAEVEKAVGLFLDYYRDHMLDHTVPYPGVRAALDELSHKKLAVLTNKPVVFSRHLLRGLDMARYFAFVYGGNSFDQKKPDPVGVHTLMRELSAAPAKTLIVGDSDTDVLTGRNAGVWTCGVTYGIGSASLESEPPDLLLQNMRELPPLLNGRMKPGVKPRREQA
jgi:phosphoglycolate phosphatase